MSLTYNQIVRPTRTEARMKGAALSRHPRDKQHGKVMRGELGETIQARVVFAASSLPSLYALELYRPSPSLSV